MPEKTARHLFGGFQKYDTFVVLCVCSFIFFFGEGGGGMGGGGGVLITWIIVYMHWSPPMTAVIHISRRHTVHSSGTSFAASTLNPKQ